MPTVVRSQDSAKPFGPLRIIAQRPREYSYRTGVYRPFRAMYDDDRSAPPTFTKTAMDAVGKSEAILVSPPNRDHVFLIPVRSQHFPHCLLPCLGNLLRRFLVWGSIHERIAIGARLFPEAEKKFPKLLA
jgi:hypothetical protein